ncbi:coiled-coil domain-containing protein 27 [Platysternon megacephalum]|uniref:Coiled-coil domain-containing protein 27 n=1 Tax=Platysternon megacephalum TaxID=55544 RepID=A0A4D9F3T1_9SAUR|nr:coiled-coil domain-containing protein 27 [Platysternon megacephalum]
MRASSESGLKNPVKPPLSLLRSALLSSQAHSLFKSQYPSARGYGRADKHSSTQPLSETGRKKHCSRDKHRQGSLTPVRSKRHKTHHGFESAHAFSQKAVHSPDRVLLTPQH